MITKQDFKKLKQNDRIEFLLRVSRLEKHYEDNSSGAFETIYMFLGICGFIMVMSLLLYISDSKAWYDMIMIIRPLSLVCGIAIIFQVSVDIWNHFRLIKERDELESEFFEVKAKK